MESEVKIDRIKEINRQNLPQFRISQTGSALRGLARQFRISPQLSSLAGLREFMQMVSRSPQFDERESQDLHDFELEFRDDETRIIQSRERNSGSSFRDNQIKKIKSNQIKSKTRGEDPEFQSSR